MKAAILRELEAEYEQLRAADLAEEKRREADAIACHPEIGRLLDSRREIIYSGMRGILSGHATAGDMQRRMEEINAELSRVLVQNDHPANWLDPVYRCPLCRDTGYRGELIKEMCSCMRAKYNDRLYSEIGLNNADGESFEAFDVSLFDDSKKL